MKEFVVHLAGKPSDKTFSGFEVDRAGIRHRYRPFWNKKSQADLFCTFLNAMNPGKRFEVSERGETTLVAA